jgi:hypothetical protein
MKIAFSGPSGVGKTTLCKHVEKVFGVPHLSTSASDVFSEKSTERLTQLGWTQSGHKDVIIHSMKNPKFGKAFQDLLLKDRTNQIKSFNKFVIDRCPIDNLVYRILQVGIHDSPSEWTAFLTKALRSLQELDLIILVLVSSDIPGIEDNNSRIPNIVYQSAVSSVFEMVFTMLKNYNYVVPNRPLIRIIDTWDLGVRKARVNSFLSERFKQTRLEL